MKKMYLSSYCNRPHDLETGKPVGHECRVIPPAALQMERAEEYDVANDLMSRCGVCANCKKLEKVQKAVLRCCNPPFSLADQDVVDVWNRELADLPCMGRGAR